MKKRFLLNPIVLRCIYRIINGVNYALSSWGRLKWIVVGGLIVVGVFIPEITWLDFLMLSFIYLLFKYGYRHCFIRLSNSIVLIKGRENSISQSVLDDSVYKTINSRDKDDRQQVLNLFIEDIELALLSDDLEAMNSVRIQSHPTIINKIISSDKINEVYLIEKIGDKKSSYCYMAECFSLISEKELLRAVKEDKEWVHRRYFQKRPKEVLKLKRRVHEEQKVVENKEEGLINRKSISNHDKLNLLMIVLNFLLIGCWIGCFRLPSTLLELFILLIVVILTTIFHEWLHIVMFKWFGKGEAETRVIRDKKLRALMIYQSNPNVVYTKKETFWILLTPFLLITLLSLLFMMIDLIYWIVSMNMILNALGSCLDIALCLKMYRDYPKYQSVSYVYEAGEGVSIVLKK